MSAFMKNKAGIWLSNSEGLWNTFTSGKLSKPGRFQCQYFMTTREWNLDLQQKIHLMLTNVSMFQTETLICV